MQNIDEDQNELLQDTDDESLSETEDQCLPENKTESNSRHNLIFVDHTKAEFILVKVSLILSTVSVLILLPLYMETVNVSGDVYSLIITNTFLSATVLTLFVITTKYLCAKYKNFSLLKLPIKLPKLVLLSFIYFLCGIVIIYALDRKRVLCHLQDPMKGLVLVWSLLYYFIFCPRFMCLQRIFSVTVIIVGLFIAVDYSVCNEFKCRGYERQRISDDRGNWTWQSHAIWTSIYMGGIALCAAFYTMLEHALNSNEKTPIVDTNDAPLLSTVSSSVSTNSACSSTHDIREETRPYKKLDAIHFAMWMHIFGFLIVIALHWSDYISVIGKGASTGATTNYTLNGIRCHFSSEDCGGVVKFSWLFLCAYLAFVATSIHFLILTQSSVYTVATMTTALPLLGVWWSLFQMVPIEQGLLIWNPSFSGEIISSSLSLPIVMVGLYFLYKSHFKDYLWSRMIMDRSLPTSSHC